MKIKNDYNIHLYVYEECILNGKDVYIIKDVIDCLILSHHYYDVM